MQLVVIGITPRSAGRNGCGFAPFRGQLLISVGVPSGMWARSQRPSRERHTHTPVARRQRRCWRHRASSGSRSGLPPSSPGSRAGSVRREGQDAAAVRAAGVARDADDRSPRTVRSASARPGDRSPPCSAAMTLPASSTVSRRAPSETLSCPGDPAQRVSRALRDPADPAVAGLVATTPSQPGTLPDDQDRLAASRTPSWWRAGPASVRRVSLAAWSRGGRPRRGRPSRPGRVKGSASRACAWSPVVPRRAWAAWSRRPA